MTYTWEIVIRLRPTILVAAAALALLSLPSQILELYLIDIETVQEAGREPLGLLEAARPMLFAMLAGLGTMVVLWLSSVHLCGLDPARPNWSRLQVLTAHALIISIALAPMIGVLGGLANIRTKSAQIAPGADSLGSGVQFLEAAVLTYMAASAALLLAMAACVLLANALWLDRVARAASRIYSRGGALTGVVLIALLTAVLVISPTRVPQAVGTQFLAYCFLAALAFALTWFSTIYRRSGWPVTVLVIGIAVLFSLLERSDNRQIDFKPAAAPPMLEERLVEWLRARKDLDYYVANNKPYPVYLVAAEGGGIYAGYHVASLLAQLQDSCPNFAQHVFAISSVSGGSLGAAVFASLASRSARNEARQECALTAKGRFQQATDKYFENDLLSALVGATLFPDTLQRLIPFPVKELSRARALERAFAEAWVETEAAGAARTDNPFDRSIHDMWSPTGAEPALFLNTTGVTSGGRVTLGPIYFDTTPTAVHIAGDICPNDPKGIALPVKTAVSLSARFPLLTPAGWFDVGSLFEERRCDPNFDPKRAAASGRSRRIYLADGGYFENSGLETIAELVKRLRGHVRDNTALPAPVEFRIIMATAADETARRFWSGYPDIAEDGPGELLTPLTVLLATRVARTRSVQARESAFDADMNKLSPGASRRAPASRRSGAGAGGCDRLAVAKDIHMVELDGTKFFLPLGWRLSKLAMANIAGHQTDCRKETFNRIVAELSAKDL